MTPSRRSSKPLLHNTQRADRECRRAPSVRKVRVTHARGWPKDLVSVGMTCRRTFYTHYCNGRGFARSLSSRNIAILRCRHRISSTAKDYIVIVIAHSYSLSFPHHPAASRVQAHISNPANSFETKHTAPPYPTHATEPRLHTRKAVWIVYP